MVPHDGGSGLAKGDPGAAAHAALPCPGERTVRGRPSASPKEGSHRESDMLTSWFGSGLPACRTVRNKCPLF